MDDLFSSSGRAAAPSISERLEPWAELKTFTFHPTIFKTMLGAVSKGARNGDLVTVYDRQGYAFGTGLLNLPARVPLRIFRHGAEAFGEDDFDALIDQSVALRREVLKVDRDTEAFRAIHSDGDGLSGLVVDKFGDTLSVQVHCLGIYQRLPRWLPRLKEALGASQVIVSVDERAAELEGIRDGGKLSDAGRLARFSEHGIRYEVDFQDGHKTGFFCDQRENRRRIADFTKGAKVADICCYTGGFSLNAALRGEAAEVTAIDLDEKAIAMAKRNANLNNARVNWTHCDAFSWARQMEKNGSQWDVIILDPPKLIHSRDTEREGLKKYEDLNQLALRLMRPGGIFVTFSCSGLLSAEDFEKIVCRSAHRCNRRLQIFDRTGAAADHPVMSNCPESRYLKAIWARVV